MLHRRVCWLVLCMLCAVSSLRAAEPASYRNLDTRECPVLDMPFRTFWGLEGGYAFPAESTAPAWDDVGMVEAVAWARFVDWENDIGGGLEIYGRWESLILQGVSGTGSDGYPLTTAGLAFRWSQRYLNGYGLMLDAAPGIHSTLDTVGGNGFAVPCGATLVKAFSPDFAIFAGASVYPGFDQVVDPRGGLRWALRDSVIVDLAYPETRLVLAPHRRFQFVAGARAMLWPEYDMGDDDARKTLRYDEIRAYGGFDIGVTESVDISLRGGYLFGREISFETGDPDVEIEDAPFAGVAISGRL